MNEKDFMKKIFDDAQDITPPASLQPDAIEQMLLSEKQEKNAENETPALQEPEKTNRPQKSRTLFRSAVRWGSMAAVFALCLTVAWQAKQISDLRETEGNGEVAAADTFTAKEAARADTEPSADSAVRADTEPSADSDITWSGQDASSQKSAVTAEETKSGYLPPSDNFTYATDYQEIYRTLYDQIGSSFTAANGARGSIVYEEDAEAMPELSATMTADTAMYDTGTGKAAGDFSTTNLQELGVDEGDIVKTDGSWIYILRQNGSFAIVKADGDRLETVSVTGLNGPADASVQEMYLDGDTLAIITTEYSTTLENDSEVYYTSTSEQAVLRTYDISDRSAPALLGTVTQEGYYRDSRKNGSWIYLFTSYRPSISDTYEDSTIAPRINGKEAAASDFYIPDSLTDSTCLVISSVNTEQPSGITDTKILVSGASNFYVSTDNIYIANEMYRSSQARTEITKFHYENGCITGVAAGSVRGYLNNSFSMNEYDGKLRVVTTYYGDDLNIVRDLISEFTGEYYSQNWEEHNSLYVLDESLKQIGAVEGLAEGETIRSARFFGDICYFVTFRQTDPLFSVDLSDPSNPRVLGELKISGFSSYLHLYGENLLLGIGYEADENTGSVSGLKLSMFDISDPTSVTEVHRLVIPGITWCPAIEDYKSILVEPEKNLIGFYCDNRYMVFSYDPENGFVRELLYDFYEDMLASQAKYNTMRGLYIGDTFYLAGDTFVLPFDMNSNFEKKALLAIE
ncbi:MAG: beta-propeller domain-containing protein [Candidatus Choladocola sp.]|nr:beta-propeller domain-containing protein [Candidatus Choladocola sp.]